MSKEPTITREIAPLPERAQDAHKGDAGRLVIVGGCAGPSATMIGAPALAANAAFRSGAGLVQLIVPEEIQGPIATLAPCATLRPMPTDADGLCEAVAAFKPDAVALGPGLGQSITATALTRLLGDYQGPVVIDADGLNLLATAGDFTIPDPARVVLTPHPGEAKRLLRGRNVLSQAGTDNSPAQRRHTAGALVAAYGSVVVLKGFGTIVTDGQRLYVNETGNAGMATGGAGDVLTGVIAALLGQQMPSLEAAILSVYLHGLAGDFAAEELGRMSVTAADLIDFLPEAFCDHDAFHEE